MNKSQALVSRFVISRGDQLTDNLAAIACGVVVLSLLAQISIPLPWTPVPITGQTFGVALIALMWGFKRGFASVLSYLLLGASGLPIFASGKAGVGGPTTGYLFGMLAGALVMGTLSDRGFGGGGFTKSFRKALLASYLGSACVFLFGLAGLSFFIPREALLTAGLYPFLFGDLLKNTLAATLVAQSEKYFVR